MTTTAEAETTLDAIIEAALLAAGGPLNLVQLSALFDEPPSRQRLLEAMASLQQQCAGRGIELVEVASGFRFQVKAHLMPVVGRLNAEKAPRYSRALLETLAVIAYRQPVTRAEIEEIRGVQTNPNILRTLEERGLIRTLGHRDVPGRPELLGTTRAFLDHFGLTRLDQLPTLPELRDLEPLEPELPLEAQGPLKDPTAVRRVQEPTAASRTLEAHDAADPTSSA